MPRIHTEQAFEDFIVLHLTEQAGYLQRPASDYDASATLLPDALRSFLQQSQPKAWELLENVLSEKAWPSLLKEVQAIRKSKGTLYLLRHEVEVYGVTFDLAYFRPAHDLNPDTLALYAANELAVVKQVEYEGPGKGRLDLLVALNGIPVMTIELKNQITGQTAAHAQKQYNTDRDPKQTLFKPREGALVHFAVDTDVAYMSTKLAGRKTFWLPFNKGNDKGAGNPAVEGKHRTHYLWEEAWQRDSLLDLIGRFLHDDGEKLLFPRYHQMDVVRKLSADTKANGAGSSYLIQHSAGSGKTNSISWLSYHLATLYNGEGKKVFDSVIVVSDRRVLDEQLQRAISQLEHKPGFVQTIDKDSKQLADALSGGVPVIITTIQKFPFVVEKLNKLPGNHFAIIIDEAHSSQGGTASRRLKEALTEEPDGEDMIYDEVSHGGRIKNISYFAFTATPKPKTVELFGTPQEDGSIAPYHNYSMRQAIEEGFILDVLRNYVSYDTYFGITKAINDNPELPKKKANKAIGRFLSLHPHNLSQKTQVMVEHFNTVTRHKIGGKAKAMVVTGSRQHALRYYRAFQQYIKEQGYDHIKPLVAFSGSLFDDDLQKEITEGQINGFSESELPDKFSTDEYKILLVADKYQTGFDQPLLQAMFVDKQMSGVKMVQTLSRLNRTFPGKDDTFILDFANSREEVLKAFQEFYEVSHLAESTDPQRLYEIRRELLETGILLEEEMRGLFSLVQGGVSKPTARDQGKLNHFLDPAVDRYVGKLEEEQDKFKKDLRSFLSLYGWLWQILPFHSDSLEELSLYGKHLMGKLPKQELGEQLRLTDEVELEYYRLQVEAEGALELKPGAGEALQPNTAAGTGRKDEEKAALSDIISQLNEKLGTDFSETDKLLFDQVQADLFSNERLMQQAKDSSPENFRDVFVKEANEAFVQRHSANSKTVEKYFENEGVRSLVIDVFLKQLYDQMGGLRKH